MTRKKKRKWTQPKLIALIRKEPSEFVLSLCKSTCGGHCGSGSSASDCWGQQRHCQACSSRTNNWGS